MFNRKQIKENAKTVLKRSYWMSFLVSLLVGIATGGVSIGGSRWNVDYNLNGNGIESGDMQQLQQLTNGNVNSQQLQQMQELIAQNGPVIAAAVVIGLIVAIIIGCAWSFFVSSPAQIGQSRFFIATREQQNPVDFSYVLYGFKYNYLKQAWAYFSTQLIIALWGLIALIPYAAGIILMAVTKQQGWMGLFALALPCMIPAIIKSYQYKMVPYVLANNSTIDGKRARELSTSMTDGNKWKLFVLDLSFIGWLLLGCLACGIGVLFVLPYINASYAEAYTCLKAEAMQTKGVSGDGELPALAGATV